MGTAQVIAIIGAIVGIIGAVVALAGWLSNRDKKTAADAQRRGEITAKLDSILASVTGVRTDVDKLDNRMIKYGERLVKVEESVRSAHHRLDEIKAEGRNE